MPAITDAIMASIPIEDAGVGSAVNDVSREVGSALGIAVIGSFVSSIYRRNVENELAGEVDESVLEAAREGVGVIAAVAQSLPPDLAEVATAGANKAFVDAMSVGFWVSAAVLATGVVVALWLLPDEARTDQVERVSDKPNDSQRPRQDSNLQPSD